MSTKKKTPETKEVLQDENTDFEICTLWKGGMGSIEDFTVARDQGEAINNLIEKRPELRAIGCYAEPFGPIDGCEIVAIVPGEFEHGNDKRNGKKIDKKVLD